MPGPASLRIRASALYDATGAFAGAPAEIGIQAGRIFFVSRPTSAPPGFGEEVLDLTRGTVLPGFVDVHAHFTFGTGDRAYETVMAEDSDELMVNRGRTNLATHLAAGVTTARDCGARSNTAFELRKIAAGTDVISPRLLVSGPPLTRPRGHFWYCGGEAGGVDGVEARASELIAAGADFLKIMASGGGTVGTDQAESSFSVAELEALVGVARSHGLLTAAHCLSAASVDAAVRAGVDQLEHINFIRPDGSRRMDDRTAERIVSSGVFVSPTIQTGYRLLQQLRTAAKPDPPASAQMAALEYKLESKLSFVSRLHEMGAKIVLGTDAIGAMGDYGLGLSLLVQAGLSTTAALDAGTRLAAEAIGLGDDVGTVSPGRFADLVVVDGDPILDINATTQILLVMREGRIVWQAPDTVRLGGSPPK